MTARITVKRIGDSEIRITLTADIRVSGDAGRLLRPQGTSASAWEEAGGRQAVPFRSS